MLVWRLLMLVRLLVRRLVRRLLVLVRRLLMLVWRLLMLVWRLLVRLLLKLVRLRLMLPDDTGMFWGLQYYNDMLLAHGDNGNVQTGLLLHKDQGDFTFR